jgi:hypothetical protein
MAQDYCAEVGDPKRFYFIFPAENDAGKELDINEAVRRDEGQTSVCMLYLTHMLGRERAEALMANKKLRDKHLVVFPMPNFQNKGLNTIVLRYSAIPALNNFQKYYATTLFGEPLEQMDVPLNILQAIIGAFFALGGGLGLGLKTKVINEKKELVDPPTGVKAIFGSFLILGLVLLGIPIAKFMSALKAASNDRDRLRELEANRMGYLFQRWQEPPQLVEEPSNRAVAAGVDRRTSPKALRQSRHRSHTSPRKLRRQALERAYRAGEQDFKRLRAQSPEAVVAGGADPRTYRTERARLQKMEESSSRSRSGKKSARAGSSQSRRRA